MTENPSPTPSGNRWEPPAVPTWHPEHVIPESAATSSRTATSELPPISGASADGVPVSEGRKRRWALSPRLKRRAATGAAAAALLAVGGFAAGSATADETATTSVVQQDGTTTAPDGDGFPGGRPDLGQGVPPGLGGTPPGTDDGTTDGGTTDDGTTDGTAGDRA